MTKLGVIDEIVDEPLGGAHRDVALMMDRLGDSLAKQLQALSQLSAESLQLDRREKYLSMGSKGLN